MTTFPAYIYLENGDIFEGQGFGMEKFEVAELVFNTSLTGYQEIMTDPSYQKQIITFTNPHIGNTGVNSDDNESKKIYASGMIIRSLSKSTSNWRSENGLSKFMHENQCIGLSEIDTRAIVNILRAEGSLKSVIASKKILPIENAASELNKFSGLSGLDLAQEVTTNVTYEWKEGVWPEKNIPKKPLHIVAYDYGIKENILRLLVEHVGKVTVVNAKLPIADVLEMDVDGIFLSNGPGDPEPCDYAIENIKLALEKRIPVFGICLGHQLLAIAGGCQTYKMKFGHHGANHPVKDTQTNEVFITSQNHGFAVKKETIPSNISVTHLSLFDDSIQGIEFSDSPAFSFQGHPEASPGPHELISLFKKFKELIKKENAKKK